MERERRRRPSRGSAFFVARVPGGYDLRMPSKPPLISSAPLRSAVIGGGMLTLLFGSLALAWGLTGAPISPPQTPEPERFDMGGLNVALPSAWQLESVVPGADNEPRRWYFVNTVSPAERLRIELYTTPVAVEPEQVLKALILQQRLVAGLIFNRAETPPLPVQAVAMEDGEALDTYFAIERNARVQTSPQLHAIRLFTPDRKQFWLFHLTDQVSRENFSPQVESGHREQLRRIADTLKLSPANPGEG